jgi:hypothetical protein
MATFPTQREARERRKNEREQKKKERLYFNDLMWAAKRRYLDEKEWYDLHKLNEEYGSWGPERSEYEFSVLGEMREFFKRHEVGSKCPHLNALEKHLADHASKQRVEEKARSKKIVKAHPSEKLVAKLK